MTKLQSATLFMALAALPLAAQTPPPAANTCTTPPTGLTTLNFERATTLSNILTTLTPNLPANVLAAITSGAQEIREIFIYNPQQGTVTSTAFLVAAGAPLPTPNFDFQTGVVQTTTIKVSQILTGCNPVPSALIVGTVSDSSATGAFGSLKGAPAAISIGYTTSTSGQIANIAPRATATGAADTTTAATINNVVEVIAGVADVFSAAGTGTVVFPAAPVLPPGSTGNVSIVVTSPQTGPIANGGVTPIQVHQNPLLLDASGSTGSGALTFTWTSVGQPVGFQGTDKPGQILVNFPSKGDFKIMLTVTDTTTGTAAQFTVILEFN